MPNSLGAWLLDFSSQLPPTSIFIGVDISTDLFPKSHPRNIAFSQCSTTNMPLGWTGKFDFVHQRFLIAGFTPADWSAALQEIHRVLSPGGWVQLVEVAGWSGAPATARCWKAIWDSSQAMGVYPQIAEKLPDMLSTAGFSNVAIEDRKVPLNGESDRARKACISTISVFRAANAGLTKKRGVGIEDFDNLLSAMVNEWNDVNGAQKGFRLVYGQKPFQ